LQLDQKLIPLSSSHTQSSTEASEDGRPKVRDEDLSDAGEVTQEHGSNDD